MAKAPGADEFYAAVGKAIVQWSKVEDAFCDLFRRLTICALTGGGVSMGKEKELPTSEGTFLLGNIFYSSSNFRGRLDLLNHMMTKLVSDEQLLTEWNAIKNKATKLYARRNVLAHGASWGAANAAPEFMMYSIFSVQDQSMDFQQITDASGSFATYSQRITQLAIDVNRLLASRKL